MKPRVFIIHDRDRYDTAPAEFFGERIFLEPETNPFNTNVFIKEIMEILAKYRFDNKTDFIAHVGPHVASGLFVGAVMAGYAPVHLLLYNAPNSTYQHKTVNIEYKEEDNDTESSATEERDPVVTTEDS